MFDAKIINYVESKLSKTSGMQVLLNSAVVGVEPTIVKIKSKEGEVSNVPYVCLVIHLAFVHIPSFLTQYYLYLTKIGNSRVGDR
jgi:NADH dehydrogenase FAD-containing subunit